MLVEDDPTLSDAFSILLEKEGYEVENAFNGKEAIHILERFTPNIIILDLLMPIMDGREFLKSFKNEYQIPIIVFSNLDSNDEITEVLSLGASRYMLKAWASPKELVRIINDTISESLPVSKG